MGLTSVGLKHMLNGPVVTAMDLESSILLFLKIVIFQLFNGEGALITSRGPARKVFIVTLLCFGGFLWYLTAYFICECV